MGDPPGASLRTDSPRIAALVLLAAAIRTLAWHRTAALFNDGPHFIGLARLVSEGEWGALIAHPYHPLYPLAIALAQRGFESWETAAVAVSVAAGCGSVVALFVFLRDAFDRRVATLGALVLAIHPYAVAFSSDVQSDGLYLALFLCAVALLWKALRSGRYPVAAAAGAATGLAYLTRPEGIGVAVVGVVFCVAELARRRWSASRALAWGGALVAGCALLMAPYAIALRAQTGSWTLTQKKSLLSLSGPDRGAGPRRQLPAAVEAAVVSEHPFLETVLRGPRIPASAPASHPVVPSNLFWRHEAALRELNLAWFSLLRPELALLLVLGVRSLWRRPSERGALVLGVVGLYGIVLYGLAFGSGYVSRRHALPPISLALGYVALGLPIVGSWLVARLGRQGRAAPPWLAVAVGTALVVGIAAPKVLQQRREDRLAERRAAEWLQSQPERTGAVAARKLRVAYYADSPYVPLPAAGSRPLLEYLRAADARYMIVDDHYLGSNPAFDEVALESIHEVYRTEAGGRSAAVFAIEQVQ